MPRLLNSPETDVAALLLEKKIKIKYWTFGFKMEFSLEP